MPKRNPLARAFINALSMAEYHKLRATAVEALADKDVPLVLEAVKLCEHYEDLFEGTVTPGEA